MGNLPTAILPSLILPVEHYVSELQEVEKPLKSLGSTRFFKVVRARHAEGPIVVKVLVKHDPNLNLALYQDELSAIKEKLDHVPNVLPFSLWRDSDRAAFLIRPFVRYSLAERMFSLPSLEPLEKKWIVFQLLTALAKCHEMGICHGDIKPENVLLTGWNWVLLADFASFKPSSLPPDNPATFSFFFDTSRRSCCYVAPERFSDSKEVQELSPRMDIFSLGCLIAELFTNGQALFDLPRLLDYASGKSFPDSTLDLITDKDIHALVKHMINVSPANRYSAHKYLDGCRRKVMPEYFYSYFHHFLTSFSASVDPPHLRIRQLHRDIDQVLDALTRDTDRRIKDSPLLILPCVTCFIHTSRFRQARLQTLDLLRLISDHLSDPPILERVVPYIIYFLREDRSAGGAEEPVVRAQAIETLSHCVSRAKHAPNNELDLFPRYVLPALKPLTRDSNILVQASLAKSIGTLAETSLRFLEHSQLASSKRALRTNTTPASFEEEWKELRESVQQLVVHLLSSTHHEVRKTLLVYSLPQLCLFFGQQRSNDIILSHMITFLNDKQNWEMRAAFFQHVPSVAAFVGLPCIPMLTPLIYMGLSDHEEMVCCRAVNALSSLTELGLMRLQELPQVLRHVSPLLVHPNLWIRHAATGFILAAFSFLSLVDAQCKLLPILRAYLRGNTKKQTFSLSSPDSLVLFESLLPPISRDLFNTALTLPGARKLLEERQRFRERQEGGGKQKPVNPSLNGPEIGIINKLQSMGMQEGMESTLYACLPVTRTHNNQQEQVPYKSIQLSEQIQLRREQLSLTSKTPPPERKDVRRTSIMPGRRIRINPELELASVLNFGWTQQVANESIEQTLRRTPGDEVGMDTQDGKRLHRASCAAELHSLLEFKRNRYEKDVQKKPSLSTQGGLLDDLLDIQYGAIRAEKRGWRPQGSLVAHFHEHGAAVNRIAVSQQQNYFVTCSDDGLLKLWNMDRIEGRKLGCKARKTIPLNAGRIKTVRFCQDNLLVGATDDGSIVLVRPLDQGSNNSLVYKRQLDVWERGSVVDLATFCYHSGELLVYVTEHGALCGLDRRSNTPAWEVQNKQKLGLITALAADHGQSWVTLGTSLGAYVCWDIRFLLPVNEWKHPSSPNTPKNVYKTIYRMQPHPTHSNSMLAAFNINNEVAIWDLETANITQKLWAGVGSDLAGKMGPSQHSVRAILPFLSDDTPLVLTAGTDHCIRMWDLLFARESKRIIEAADTESLKRDIKFNEVFKNDVTIFQEETSPPSVIHKGTESRQKLDTPPNGHQDTITDLALVRTSPSRDFPSQNFVVSVSRDGVMKVWK